MIYLYGLTGPLRAQVQSIGLGGAPVEAMAVGRITTIHSMHDQLDLEVTADSCWAHEHVVEAVMRSQTVLPARFATTFSDIEQVRAAVACRADALAQRLTDVEGCVELAVRIGLLAPEDQQPGDGREYLLGKLAVQRRREALAEGTLACLKELAVASRLAAPATSNETVSISYLIETTEIERFAHAVDRLGRRWPELCISCTGPWAPYSFTDAPIARWPSTPDARVPAEVV